MPSVPNERALQPIREEGGALVVPQHTQRELDALIAEQYADDISSFYERSIDDILDDGDEPPPVLSFVTAWEQENERYRRARRSR